MGLLDRIRKFGRPDDHHLTAHSDEYERAKRRTEAAERRLRKIQLQSTIARRKNDP